ncbi:MAG: hypothetical protein Kapaf2KO_03170 [Candidatus Kapaibacteriales bacterium]
MNNPIFRTIILFIFALFALTSSFTQPSEEIESLIIEGIKLHEAGEYEDAVETYKKALEINPYSNLAKYELGITYTEMEEYDKAIKLCEEIMESDDEHYIGAATIMGNCLDMQGKTEESIELFEEVIDKKGGSLMLHFNLAINYLQQENWKKIEEHTQKALMFDFTHPSSHFFLGVCQMYQNNRIESILSLSHFLIIENNSQRSSQGYAILQELVRPAQVSNDSTGVQIMLPFSEGEFASEEMSLSLFSSLVVATNGLDLEKEIESSEQTFDDSFHMKEKAKQIEDEFSEESDFAKTMLFFIQSLSNAGDEDEENSDIDKDNFWRKYYIPFYQALGEEDDELMKAYLQILEYTTLETEEDYQEFEEENLSRMRDFYTWAYENLPIK